jgi:hypothetical protein
MGAVWRGFLSSTNRNWTGGDFQSNGSWSGTVQVVNRLCPSLFETSNTKLGRSMRPQLLH